MRSSALRPLLRYVRARMDSRAESLLTLLETATRPELPIADVLVALDNSRKPLATALRSEAQALKILNLLLCRHHYRNRSRSVLSRPVGLILDPINTCQLACPGCVHSRTAGHLFSWSSQGLMREAAASTLFARYGPYAVQASFCNYGEPTLNPETPCLIQIAKRYALHTTMSSNLAHPKFRPEEWIGSGLDFLIVSIDGITEETYSRFRRQGRVDVALSNLQALVAAKRTLRSLTPVIHWQYLAFEHNRHEIDHALELATGLGVNQFAVTRPFDVSWDDPSVRIAEDVVPRLHRFDTTLDRWMAYARNQFKLDEERIHAAFEAGFGQLAEPDSASSSGHTCSWLYKNMTVDANGRVLPCCCSPRPDADLVFADIRAEDAFNSPKYHAARSQFAGMPAGDTFCTRCDWPQDKAQIDTDEVYMFLRSTGAFSGDTMRRVSRF